MEEEYDIQMYIKFMYLETENNTPLNLHEIPEWIFQTPTRMGIFHPRNWLKQENQSSTSSHNSQMKISQMSKRFFSWMIPIFYKNYWYYKAPNTSINQFQVELVWLLMLCHDLSLHLPSSPKFEQEPLGLLKIPNSTYKMLYSVLKCQYVSISSLISELCHKCHRISIIGVIDVINVRGIQPSVHETPIWLFLSHVSYNSSQI